MKNSYLIRNIYNEIYYLLWSCEFKRKIISFYKLRIFFFQMKSHLFICKSICFHLISCLFEFCSPFLNVLSLLLNSFGNFNFFSLFFLYLLLNLFIFLILNEINLILLIWDYLDFLFFFALIYFFDFLKNIWYNYFSLLIRLLFFYWTKFWCLNLLNILILIAWWKNLFLFFLLKFFGFAIYFLAVTALYLFLFFDLILRI